MIPNEAWIYGEEEVAIAITNCIKRTWSGGGLPKEWKKGVVKPIFKKGDIDCPGNYRGIRTQFGFRKGKGTIEAINVLAEIIDDNIRKERGKIYVCFADLKAAFDKLKREKIWEILRKKNVIEGLIERIEKIYKETAVEVIINEKLIDELETEKGVRQGYSLSTELFNVSMSDLEEEMRKTQGAGAKFGKKRICTISYADDIAIMADNEEVLKEMIKRFVRYIRRKGLELNVDKTKIIFCDVHALLPL